jgi:hypothetical protein
VNLNTAGVKTFMVALHFAALVAGLALGHWVFDVVAY